MSISKWKRMLGKGETAKVLVEVIDMLETLNEDKLLNDMLSHSARQERLREKFVNNQISDEQSNVSQNKINKSILITLDEINDAGILTDTHEITPNDHTTPVKELKSLDQLKDRARFTFEMLKYLRKEESLTFGKAEFVLKKQIEQTEINLEEIKNRIANFNQ